MSQVMVPDIGTDEAVDLIEVIVKVGDSIAEGDSLVVWNQTRPPWKCPPPPQER